MKTVKIMSIISYVICGLSFICMSAYNSPIEYEAAIGWGVILFFWTVAYTVVCHVQANKHS